MAITINVQSADGVNINQGSSSYQQPAQALALGGCQGHGSAQAGTARRGIKGRKTADSRGRRNLHRNQCSRGRGLSRSSASMRRIGSASAASGSWAR